MFVVNCSTDKTTLSPAVFNDRKEAEEFIVETTVNNFCKFCDVEEFAKKAKVKKEYMTYEYLKKHKLLDFFLIYLESVKTVTLTDDSAIITYNDGGVYKMELFEIPYYKLKSISEILNNELDKFIRELNNSTPANVIELAEELVIKENICCYFDCLEAEDELESYEDLIAYLISIEKPLDFLYNEWEKQDDNFSCKMNEFLTATEMNLKTQITR